MISGISQFNYCALNVPNYACTLLQYERHCYENIMHVCSISVYPDILCVYCNAAIIMW